MIGAALTIGAENGAAARAGAAGSVAALIAATGGGANATFNFQHRVFALPGARFAVDWRAQATMFYVDLGNLKVSLTPTVLRREFNIEDNSYDSQLIDLAAAALRHVSDVRSGDSIPKELVDGSASWSVDESHRRRAKAKLLLEVLRWFADGGATPSVDDILAMSEEDIAASEEFRAAFAAVAQALGIDAASNQEIADQIDALARELSYVEALHDYADRLGSIHEKVLRLSRIAKSDHAIGEKIARALMLLKLPLAEFADRFARIDAQASELLPSLCQPRATVRLIRGARDDLHASLLPWADLFERWEDQVPFIDHRAEENLDMLYGWLAANYAPSRVWR